MERLIVSIIMPVSSKYGNIEDQDTAAFDRVLAVNVKGVFLGFKYVLPIMKKQERVALSVPPLCLASWELQGMRRMSLLNLEFQLLPSSSK